MTSGKTRRIAVLMMAVLMTATAACTKTDDTPKETAAKEANTPDGPAGMYSPPITVTTVRATNNALLFQGNDNYDNNVWYREYEKTLGIKLENKWKVSDQQYANKITVSMVANDLPDFFMVDPQQLKLLVDADQIADLTGLYEKYASDLSKKALTQSNGLAKKAATFNGKYMAIPLNGGNLSDMQMIYIRKDWLDKLKLEPPKNIDDVVKIAIAFANDDPDGNGKKDTFGLSLDYNLFNGWSGLDGFFNAFHAYPYNPAKGSGTNLMFLKGTDGKPVLADTQPEVKKALAKLQELFKAGAINPEFSTIDGNKSAALATAGKVGMTFGATFVPSWPINNMKKDDPKVDWQAYPLVSSDDKPVFGQSNTGLPTQYIVVNKNSKYPEVVFKMLNLFMEKLYGKTPDPDFHMVSADGKTYNIFSYAPIRGGFVDTNINDAAAVQEAMKTGDTSKLSTAAKGYYDKIKMYQSGDLSQWWQYATWAPGGAYSILGSYIKNDRVVTSRYFGQPTATMIAKGPALRDLEATVFTKIITGALPVDAFDTEFVAKWMSQGGKEILQEVAESGSFN